MMQFYVDDPTKPFLIETTADLAAGDTWPFNANIFLLMNVAVGGTLGGTPSASTPNPGIMMVDYVRQYMPSTAVTVPALGTPPSITVKAGATSSNASTFSPTLATGTGYVYFSCSTNAPKASCAITTTDPLNPHVISASGGESVTVAVTTTANTSEAKATPPRRSNSGRTWLPITFVGFFLSIVMPGGGGRRRRTYLYFWALVVGLALTVLLASCGGGNSTTATTTTQGSNGTTPGSYSVTVYAFTESNVSDGSNAKADASVAIPLMVN